MAKQNKKLAQIYHYDLYGKRQEKYDFLSENSIYSINWNELENRKSEYFFVKKDWEVFEDYEKGFLISSLFGKYGMGITSGNDKKLISFNKNSFAEDLNKNSFVKELNYRLFDNRYIYYDNTKVERGREELMSNLFNDNLGLISLRGVRNNLTSKFGIVNKIVDKSIVSTLDNGYVFPLYLYSNKKVDVIFTEKDTSTSIIQNRKPNLNTEIVEQIAKKIGLEFVPEKNSPPVEGCLKGGVVNNEQQTPKISINNTLIKRNFIENLPHNPKLKQLARDKRKAGILSEVLFWQQVHKGEFYKIDFDRQRIIGNYIVDFYVKTLGLVIEIDGSSHDDKEEYDKSRQDYLEALGLKVYRIEDLDVKRNIAQVMQDLENYIVLEYEDNTTPSVGHPSKGGGFAPIDILDYIYAVLHSPTYREKYKEFLKIDFPRVPFPKDKETFWQLVKLGGEIRQIHLLESPKVEEYITGYPIDGDNTITTKIGKKDWEITTPQNLPKGEALGRIWINEEQYFENIPLTAWEFYIGGYQPAQKWLKDRKGRNLSFDDILHYQKIIVALYETDRLMKEIDKIKIE